MQRIILAAAIAAVAVVLAAVGYFIYMLLRVSCRCHCRCCCCCCCCFTAIRHLLALHIKALEAHVTVVSCSNSNSIMLPACELATGQQQDHNSRTAIEAGAIKGEHRHKRNDCPAATRAINRCRDNRCPVTSAATTATTAAATPSRVVADRAEEPKANGRH